MNDSGAPIRSLYIAGTGLIGGSIAAAARLAGVEQIIGFDSDERHLQDALERGLIDRASTDLQDALDTDLLMLAAPLTGIEKLLHVLSGFDRELSESGITVTDAGSVKGPVARAMRTALPQSLSRCVPGHPIAGSERSGPQAATHGLFDGRRVILTPLAETDEHALGRVSAFWSALGATVECMDDEVHDAILARISHLPHLLAFALVEHLGNSDVGQEAMRYAAGGFRDFTRIAESDPTMWRDIFIENGPLLGDALDQLMNDLRRWRQQLANADGSALFSSCERAQTLKRVPRK